VSASGGLTISSGAAALSGAGTISTNVTNSGALIVGSSSAPGVITIRGNYTQTSTGVLQTVIGGAAAGTGYSQLQVSGTATLAGSFSTTLIGATARRRGRPSR
jgi:hypothetical protein